MIKEEEISVDWTEKDISTQIFYASFNDPIFLLFIYALITNIVISSFFFLDKISIGLGQFFIGASFIRWLYIIKDFKKNFNFVKNKIKEKKETNRYSNTMNLFKKLAQDNDDRPENCLKDLIFYDKKIRKFTFENVNDDLKNVILSSFEDLYKKCFELAEQSHDLWLQSKKARSTSQSEFLLEARERTIAKLLDVKNKIDICFAELNIKENIEDTSDQNNSKNIEGVLNEFTSNLKIMKNVENRISELNVQLLQERI